jgi:sugar lactone lactonase YvrE
MKINLTLKLVSLILVFSVALPFALAQSEQLPELIVAERPGFHPEGIVWDTDHERFLTGSFTEGTIFAIEDDGTVTPFIEDEDLVTTLGLHIDWDRLLVANAEASEDPESTGAARLGIYDLNTGERLHFVDLGSLLEEGHHLANDVTTDAEGNAYVTDSLAPVVYKVTPDGEASIFAESEQFTSDTFGLNGIEYHSNGYLLVGFSEPGALYKIPLDDPEAITSVELSEPFSPDGIVFHPNGDLIVVAAGLSEDGSLWSEVLELASDDEWASAEIVNRATTDPDLSASTVTLRDETPYVAYSHFNELFTGQSVDEFEILRIDFDE